MVIAILFVFPPLVIGSTSMNNFISIIWLMFLPLSMVFFDRRCFMQDKVFIFSDRSRSFARRYFRRYYPWVKVIARGTLGYWGFASRDAYILWRRQK